MKSNPATPLDAKYLRVIVYDAKQNQNMYCSMVKLRVVGKFLYSGYSLLNSLISQSTEEEVPTQTIIPP